jgi:integrase
VSENYEKLIAAFTRHLEVERSLSVHTIRAYLGDLESLLTHLETIGVQDISQLELVHLRSWLANQQIKGGARTTLSRRAVSVRLFTKWAVKNKYLAKDVAATLATPKGHRTLPEVLEIADAKVAMDSLATRAAEEETPISLRDVAMVELLYATGARVAELCGLDLSDIDYDRQTIRVLGKGNKERMIPLGNPAMKALYRLKINNCNLHLLIVSGLYGIIRHNDYINDYHLEINKGPNVWGINILNAVSDYIRVNNIDNDAVFYSLSGNYLPFLNPLPNWKNLWLNHGGHGHNQANDLMVFLNHICSK